MKPIYLVLIGIIILTVIFLVVRSNKKKQEQAAAAFIASQTPSSALSQGGSSGVAQIITALLPFFNTATNSGLIGGEASKPESVEPDYLAPKQVSLI